MISSVGPKFQLQHCEHINIVMNNTDKNTTYIVNCFKMQVKIKWDFNMLTVLICDHNVLTLLIYMCYKVCIMLIVAGQEECKKTLETKG